MEPALQIDPERCVLVLGSQLAASALALSEGVPAVLSYAMVVEIGMQRMLELEGVEKMEEKARNQSLMLSAYELEPSFAACKVVDSLRQHGVYQKWLGELFGSLLSLPVCKKQGGVVDTLNTLQEKGALLVYTYYDTILDSALNTPPILLDDEAAVRSWATRRTPGLLHVHGAHSHPDSVKCDCVNYRQLVGEVPGGQILREVCRNRFVVFLGFDAEFFDPFLFKFSRAFLSSSQTPPLLLSLAPKFPSLDNFLALKIPQLVNLEKNFISFSPVSRLGPTDSIENKISTTLLYSNKSSCKDAAERVKVTSGINVHQLTMRHEHLYHQLLLYLDRDGLRELWKILFVSGPQESGTGPDSPSGLHVGLLGIRLDRTVIWLNRAAALGKVTVSPLPSPMETKGLQDVMTLSSGRSGHTPSLTTNVSVISSMWTPIASPSVSKPSSTYTRPPTLPSPLISSTSRTSLGRVATKGSQQMAHVSTLSPLHLQAHGQVRRVQSEKDHLTYQDRLAKQAQMQRRINGVLHHTESAPEITGASDLMPYAAKLGPRVVVGAGKRGGTPTNHVYPLVRDGNQLEVKIECVDQMQQQQLRPPASSHTPAALISAAQNVAAHNAAAQRDLKGLSAELKSPVRALSPKGFAEERKKFISEAQNWSKQVDSELARKKDVVPQSIMSLSSEAGREQLSLGLFTSRAAQPSLSSKFSLEEQETLLRQHFELQQQQLQLQVLRGLPNPNATPSKLPLHSLSISTAHPSHARSSHAPSKVSPRQPSPSPSKSPLNQYQTSAAATTGPSLLPFLSQAAAILPNPAANFVCNPQYQAALYQIAMQQLLSSHIQGSNSMLSSGPSILQSLVDKVPIFLPDGSITFIPTTSAVQGSTDSDTPRVHRGAEISTDKGPSRSPEVVSGGGGSNHKRTRSPDVADIRGSPPKRRRSSSLPDITQPLLALPLQVPSSLKETIKEEDEVGVARGVPMVQSEEPRHRQLAPPTMIHIPQDMKLGDPMMGFPTPPQSSPLVGNFALSPIVLSSGGFQPMTPVTPNQEQFGADELRELVEAQTPLPPSPEGSVLPPFPAGRGPIQLWQFLLDLLLSPEKKHLIDWTGNGYEFRILQPEEIAKLWGARKNKPRMNYDKLSRGLRYYYSKGIMDKVQGKKLTFKYTCDVQNYVRCRQSQNSGGPRSGGGVGVVKYRSGSASEGLVPMETDGQVVEVMQQSLQQEEEGGGIGQDQSERSFSDLDLMAGFQSAVNKASEGLSGMVGVVSQGFVNPLQSGSLRSEVNQITSTAGEVGICTETV